MASSLVISRVTSVLCNVPNRLFLLCRCSTGGPNGGRSDGDDGQGRYVSICHYCPCEGPNPTIYDSRKYGHCLPNDDVITPFEPLSSMPSGIFRCTNCEILGPYANKCGCYKNPEYFSYHHMSFFDLNWVLRPYRKPSPITGRKA